MSTQYPAAPDLAIDLDKEYTATLHTNQGDITIRFRPAEAPLAVNNFVFLAGEGFYDGVIFHRVVPGFVIQGGDPTGTGSGGPGYRFNSQRMKRPYQSPKGSSDANPQGTCRRCILPGFDEH